MGTGNYFLSYLFSLQLNNTKKTEKKGRQKPATKFEKELTTGIVATSCPLVIATQMCKFINQIQMEALS